MLKSSITEPSRDNYVKYVPPPDEVRVQPSGEADPEYALFDNFPGIFHNPEQEAGTETAKTPDLLLKELHADSRNVTHRIHATADTYRKRISMSQSRMLEIQKQLAKIDAYLSNISHWAPGYNSGVDGIRNSLLSTKSHLELNRIRGVQGLFRGNGYQSALSLSQCSVHNET